MSTIDALIDVAGLQRAMNKLVETSSPGLSLHIRRGDEEVALTAGAAVLGRDAPMSEDSRFPISCMMKSALFYLVLQLHQRGSLDLDADVDACLPELASPDSRSRITVRHLLTHSGGYRDPTEKLARWSMGWDDFAEFFRHREQLLTPGACWSYTHSGHAILATLIERLEGRPALDLVREQIFAPLGINPDAPRAQYAAPHKLSGLTGRLEPMRLPPERGILRHTISDIHLTPGEMARLGRFLCGLDAPHGPDDPVHQAMRTQIFRVEPVAYGPKAERIPDSFGLGMGSVGGFLAQNGSFIGTTSSIRYDPASRSTVVVSTNIYDPYTRDHLGLRLISLVAGRAAVPPRAHKAPYDRSDLIGTWRGLMMGMGDATVHADGRCCVTGPAGVLAYRLSESERGIQVEAPDRAPALGFFTEPKTGASVMRVAVSAFKRISSEILAA